MTDLFAVLIFSEPLSGLNRLAFAIVLMGIYLARIGTGAATATDQEALDG